MLPVSLPVLKELQALVQVKLQELLTHRCRARKILLGDQPIAVLCPGQAAQTRWRAPLLLLVLARPLLPEPLPVDEQELHAAV